MLYNEQNLTVPKGWRICVVEQTDSTNAHLFRLAEKGAEQGLVLLAREQTAGKGSHARRFFSPEGGIYLSLLLKNQPVKFLPLLTPMAAVAVHRALRPHTQKELAIKWVNDLYLDGGKVCGILTETRFLGQKTITVMGIGINLLPPKEGFPTDFLHPAAALMTDPDPQRAETIISTLLEELKLLLTQKNFLEEYKDNCCTLGKWVTLRLGKDTVTGKAVDILPNGALLLRLPDGKERPFSLGEVTSQIQE